MDKYALGVKGEYRAKLYLEEKGYKIITTNVNYCGIGELDIVAMDGRTLVFVEVRTRSDNCYGHPLETFTKAKQQKVVRAAKRYIWENKPSADGFRFDAIAILNDEITHVEDAFYAKWK